MKNKRKIDVVVRFFYPVAAGIETNVLETYKVLAKQGWNITIHTSVDTLTEKNVLPKYDSLQGLKIKRYPYRWYGFIPNINYEKTDLVSLHNFNITPHIYILVIALMKKILGRKNFSLALTPHGGFNPEWKNFSTLAALIKAIYHYTIGVHLINRTIDAIRAVSEWEREEMVKKGLRDDLITVISNGIEEEALVDPSKKASKEMKRAVKNFGKYIIQIGRIYPIKNYEVTIRALAKLPKNLNYVIVGPLADKKYYEKLKKEIKNLNLENRVFFTGVVRGADKFYLIKHAQMMVHMAHWESFCNVVHEGMSQGLVCIVSNNTALPYLIKNNINGFCLDENDEEKLSQKIRFVLKRKNTKFTYEISKNNKNFARQHSWENVALKMADLYRDTIYKGNNKIENFAFI